MRYGDSSTVLVVLSFSIGPIGVGRNGSESTVSASSRLARQSLSIGAALRAVMTDREEDEFLRLMTSIARSEGLQVPSRRNCVPAYSPLYHHPLPVSQHKYQHEKNLQRIMSCKKEFQAIAAITQSDGWSLEEVYMCNGGVVLGDKNGDSPLHLAVQMESLDCIMVLLNIGVDVNKTNRLGFTPLRIAEAKGLHVISKLLRDNGGLLQTSSESRPPDVTCLEVYPESKYINHTAPIKPADAYSLSRQTHFY